MAEASQDIYQSLLDQVKAYESSIEAVEVGYVQEIGDGIARVTGLQNIRFSELVRFENGVPGIVFNLEKDYYEENGGILAPSKHYEEMFNYRK